MTLLVRPVGSAIFGHYADIRSRKYAMLIAIVGAGVTTGLFGLLLTTAQVGLAAPALFLLLRVIQGVFVGGVVASTHTIGTEWAAPNRRGAMSGLVGGGGAGIGALLAALVFLLPVGHFSRRSIRDMGMALYLLCGLAELPVGLVHFQQSGGVTQWRPCSAARADARSACIVTIDVGEMVSSKRHQL